MNDILIFDSRGLFICTTWESGDLLEIEGGEISIHFIGAICIDIPLRLRGLKIIQKNDSASADGLHHRFQILSGTKFQLDYEIIASRVEVSTVNGSE
jgi:hypothetical protein